jgi:hypothetical protein
MAKIVCILYDDPVEDSPKTYACDGVPKLKSYLDGETLPTPERIVGNSAKAHITIILNVSTSGFRLNRADLDSNKDVLSCDKTAKSTGACARTPLSYGYRNSSLRIVRSDHSQQHANNWFRDFALA